MVCLGWVQYTPSLSSPGGLCDRFPLRPWGGGGVVWVVRVEGESSPEHPSHVPHTHPPCPRHLQTTLTKETGTVTCQSFYPLHMYTERDGAVIHLQLSSRKTHLSVLKMVIQQTFHSKLPCKANIGMNAWFVSKFMYSTFNIILLVRSWYNKTCRLFTCWQVERVEW